MKPSVRIIGFTTKATCRLLKKGDLVMNTSVGHMSTIDATLKTNIVYRHYLGNHVTVPRSANLGETCGDPQCRHTYILRPLRLDFGGKRLRLKHH